jgi:hypothetical protein
VGNTMKLPVVINGVSLVALVDSGSTHTFIQEGLVSKLGIMVERRTGLSIKVANGDRVPSTGVCRQVAISIDKDTFDISCYTLAMDGFDVVLGVQWLVRDRWPSAAARCAGRHEGSPDDPTRLLHRHLRRTARPPTPSMP